MPTVAEVGGAAYPKEWKNQPILPMEGRSLIPAFADKPIERETLFWEHEGNAAVSADHWKLVRRGFKGSWKLYDLKKDRTELTDLAASNGERVDQLRTKWMDWAKRANVLPAPGQSNEEAR
jgi:arylsulfatase A-like enzyme